MHRTALELACAPRNKPHTASHTQTHLVHVQGREFHRHQEGQPPGVRHRVLGGEAEAVDPGAAPLEGHHLPLHRVVQPDALDELSVKPRPAHLKDPNKSGKTVRHLFSVDWVRSHYCGVGGHENENWLEYRGSKGTPRSYLEPRAETEYFWGRLFLKDVRSSRRQKMRWQKMWYKASCHDQKDTMSFNNQRPGEDRKTHPFPSFLSAKSFLGKKGQARVWTDGIKCGWKRVWMKPSRLGVITHPRGRDDHNPADVRRSHADLSQSSLGDPRGQRQRALGEPLESSVGVNPQADSVTEKKKSQQRMSKKQKRRTGLHEGSGGAGTRFMRRDVNKKTSLKGRDRREEGGDSPHMCALPLLSPEHSLDPWTLGSLANGGTFLWNRNETQHCGPGGRDAYTNAPEPSGNGRGEGRGRGGFPATGDYNCMSGGYNV